MKKRIYILIFAFLISSCGTGGNLKSAGLRIHDIQGCSHISPFNGEKVDQITGIVTWKINNGFFLQDSQPDGKDCTSEGIFIFTDCYPSVIPGDLVSVSGKVSEFIPGTAELENLSVTEIIAQNVQILTYGNVLPEPIIIGKGGRLPPGFVIEDDQMKDFDVQSDGLDFYESLEGMRIEVKEAIVVGPTNSYGEIFVIPEESRNGNQMSSSGALIVSEKDNNPERILIELPTSFSRKINLGDQFYNSIIGILDYEYGNYRLLEINQPDIRPRSTIPAKNKDILAENDLRIATYNVNNLNRFENKKIEELSTQIVKELRSPDILVLQEVQDDNGENDDGVTSAVKTLTVLTNQIFSDGNVAYDFIDPELENNSSGGVPGGNIRTVILYRIDRGLELIDPTWERANIPVFENSRLPLIVKFRFGQNPFYVIGVHFVSNNANSPLYGSIQPPTKPEEQKRLLQGKWVADAIEQIKTDENIPIILAGDFNDVPWSRTMNQFTKVSMNNLAESVIATERYSIIYEGNASIFDQILVTSDLLESVYDVEILHLNTDLAESKQVSDHDPFLINLHF